LASKGTKSTFTWCSQCKNYFPWLWSKVGGLFLINIYWNDLVTL